MGYVVRERELAEVEQRSSRNPYPCVPLTGCHQSMLPCYRSSAAVAKLKEYSLDERGLRLTNAKLHSMRANCDVSEDGEVQSILDDEGRFMTEDDLEADGKQWATIYARRVRAQYGQNHNHVCTKACAKYASDEKQRGADMQRLRANTCRFMLFVTSSSWC